MLFRLQQENFNLQQQLRHRLSADVTREVSSHVTDANRSSLKFLSAESSSDQLLKSIFNEELVRQTLTSSEVIHGGQALRSEYELTPFARFTMNRVYLVEPGLQKRVIEKPIGFKKRSLEKIINAAVLWLNNNRNLTRLGGFESNNSNFSVQPLPLPNLPMIDNQAPRSTNISSPSKLSQRRFIRPYRTTDFLEGIYRTVPGLSEHYELHFRDLDTPRSYRTVVMVRIFSSPLVISSRLQSVASNPIHIIVPLHGREQAFRQFMNKFEEICIKGNETVFLTIVHFGGGQEFKNVDRIISSLRLRTGFQNIRLMALMGEFSRGKALMAGANREIPRIAGRDVLLFFCDIDVIFTSDFLQRCRLNAEPGARVYYPILFSLYNPNITILSMLDSFEFIGTEKTSNSTKREDFQPMPSENANIKFRPRYPEKHRPNVITISVDSGFWRDFGYGMTCQYLSDFRKSGGFDADHKGWGMEDVFLYRKYVKSPLLVVRATDPGILHVWHDKICAFDLPADQYRSCIRSKALNEASHAQLGMLLFKSEIENHFSNSRRSNSS